MNLSVGNFTVISDEVVKWSDAAYSVGRLLALFVILFGLIDYYGKLSREKYKLKKPSRIETDLKIYARGLAFLIVLLLIVALIAPIVKFDATIFSLLGLVEYILIFFIWFEYTSSKEP